MKIKAADITDLDELTKMNILLRAEENIDNVMTDLEVKNRMQEFILGEIYKAILLTKNELIFGYALIDVTKTPIFLRQLFVKSEFRKKGFGRELIEEIAREFSNDAIDTEVLAWNESALEFYKRSGFETRYFGMRLKLNQ